MRSISVIDLSRIWYSRRNKPYTANPAVLFFAIILLAGVFLVIVTLWADAILPPVDIFTAHLFGALLSMTGVDVNVNLKMILMSAGPIDRAVNIGYGCDGVLAYPILASAIIPFPSSLWSRLAGLGSGLLFVIFINQVRLGGLVAIMFRVEGGDSFEFYHTTVGQVFALLMIFLFWQWWATLTLKGRTMAIDAGAPDG